MEALKKEVNSAMGKIEDLLLDKFQSNMSDQIQDKFQNLLNNRLSNVSEQISIKIPGLNPS